MPDNFSIFSQTFELIWPKKGGSKPLDPPLCEIYFFKHSTTQRQENIVKLSHKLKCHFKQINLDKHYTIINFKAKMCHKKIAKLITKGIYLKQTGKHTHAILMRFSFLTEDVIVFILINWFCFHND